MAKQVTKYMAEEGGELFESLEDAKLQDMIDRLFRLLEKEGTSVMSPQDVREVFSKNRNAFVRAINGV